eukprot:scaffold28014_cov45-Attheya_sp.AAC.1
MKRFVSFFAAVMAAVCCQNNASMNVGAFVVVSSPASRAYGVSKRSRSGATGRPTTMRGLRLCRKSVSQQPLAASAEEDLEWTRQIVMAHHLAKIQTNTSSCGNKDTPTNTVAAVVAAPVVAVADPKVSLTNQNEDHGRNIMHGTYIQDDRSRHANEIQSIKGASSLHEIDRLLSHISKGDLEEGSLSSSVNVNVAVAALKRITVLLHGSDPTKTTNRSRRQQRQQKRIRDAKEVDLIVERWVPRLMNHVTQTMEEWSNNNILTNDVPHTSTPSSKQQQQQQQQHDPIPFTNYALADLFFVVSQFDWLQGNMPLSRPPSIQSLCQLALVPDGGKTFCTQVSPTKLMDVWVALSPWKLLSSKTKKHERMNQEEESGGGGGNHHPVHALLRQVIGTRLSQGDAMGQLSPRLLSQGLWAMSHFEDAMVHGTLLKALCRRWRKERVRATATPVDVVRATWSASRIMEHLEQHLDNNLLTSSTSSSTPPLFMGSSSRQNETMEVQDWTMQVAMLREEAEIMVHTLCSRCLLTPTTLPNTKNNASHNTNNNSIQNDTIASLAVPLTMGQIADVLSACVTFEIGSEQPIVMALSAHLATTTTTTHSRSNSNQTKTKTSFQDLARILLSLQRLRANNIPDTIHNLGQHVLQKVQQQQQHQRQQRREPYKRQVDPKTWNTILRSAVMIHPKQQYILEPFLIATKQLIIGEENGNGDNDNDGNDFLSKACEFQVSNFIWVLSMAKWYDEELLIALSNRMMDDDILRTCSPSSASRAMWAFTTLLADTDPSWESNDNDEELQLSLVALSMSSSSSSSEAEEEDRRSIIVSNQNGKMAMREQLFELFHNLGGILLSSQLTPVDASSALFAYGKANYALDMGIVDHLAE